MIISREDMTAHINAGRARRWTRELGPDHTVLTVAQMDDAWFVVLEGTDGYQQAPEPLAWVLTAAQTMLGGSATRRPRRPTPPELALLHSQSGLAEQRAGQARREQ